MFRDKVLELVKICGSQERVAVLVGVTQAAVSAWVTGGAVRPPAERAVRQALADFYIRASWFNSWLLSGLERKKEGQRFWIKVEQLVDNRPVGGDLIEVTKENHGEVADQLAIRWLGWSTAGRGQYLIAWRALDGEDAGIIREIAHREGSPSTAFPFEDALLAGL